MMFKLIKQLNPIKEMKSFTKPNWLLKLRVKRLKGRFWYWRIFLSPAKDLKINQLQKPKLNLTLFQIMNCL